jgi:hypothetical protein
MIIALLLQVSFSQLLMPGNGGNIFNLFNQLMDPNNT